MDALEFGLRLAARRIGLAAAPARLAGVHGRNHHHVRRLVLKHPSQLRPAGVQDFPVESRFLPDIAARMLRRAPGGSGHGLRIQVLDSEQSGGVGENPARLVVPAMAYTEQRPRYKRQPKGMSMVDFRPLRNSECDELIRRLARLKYADPPMDLCTHPETRRLVAEQSPAERRAYKHREDLLDAALCAWTAALWSRYGEGRCQVLGFDDVPINGARPTIIAPARPEQRP